MTTHLRTQRAKERSRWVWNLSPAGGGVGLLAALAFLAGTIDQPQAASAQDISAESKTWVENATVMVFTARTGNQRGDTALGSGSGYFINGNGLVMTNNHVVDPTHRQSPDAKQAFHFQAGRLTWTIIVHAGKEKQATYECATVYQNEWADQAMLQCYEGRPEDGVKLTSPSFLKFLPESRLRARSNIWTFGFPGGDQRSRVRGEHPQVSITSGKILEFPRTPGGRIRMIFVDAIARPGNSGGPAVDADGFLVGTLTLMSKPEGREDTGGASYAALVPPSITREMVHNAFLLGKMPFGADLAPFVEMLTNEEGRLEIKEFARRPDNEVLFFEGGDRIFGSIATANLEWQSDLGTVEVPLGAVAYVMNRDKRAQLFLEGGNRLTASRTDASFSFTPVGGRVIRQKFNEVKVVGFRTSDRKLSEVTGEVIVIDSNAGHLVLSKVSGTTKFKSRTGEITVPITLIARVDTSADGKQVLNLVDGRRMTGEFLRDPFEGVIAATGTKITFNFRKIKKATIEIQYLGLKNVAGISLPDVMALADRDILDIARILESDNPARARPELDALTEPGRFRRLPEVTKMRVHLLNGVSHLLAGDYARAREAFDKCDRAKDENVSAYSLGFALVLDRHPDGTFEGKPLRNREVFAHAGSEIASEAIEEVRGLLKDEQLLEGKRGEYQRAISAVRTLEKRMLAVGVLGGTEADDELVRLWKYATRACDREWERLQQESVDQQQAARNPVRTTRRGGMNAGNQLSRRLNAIESLKQKVAETWLEYAIKLHEYGFRIEDPDIQSLRERR